MSKIFNILFWVLIGILVGFLLIGYTLYKISYNSCEEECEDMNSLAHKVIPSGDWFKLNDVCICVYKNKIKAFELGD